MIMYNMWQINESESESEFIRHSYTQNVNNVTLESFCNM